MARLPGPDDLGARPVPRSRRGVASNPQAGAVGDAVEAMGGQLGRIGVELKDKQDQLAVAAAKSAILKADILARRDLENDQDYATFDTRYSEKMQAARDAAHAMVPHSQRQLFDQQVDLDIERGRSQVMEAAHGKEVVAKKAMLSEGLSNLQDTALDATDEGTRKVAIDTSSMLIKSARDAGIIDPLSAVQLREGWAGDVATGWVTSALNREDPVAAQAALDKYGDLIDWKQRDTLTARLKGVTDTRETMAGVDGLMGTATATPGTALTYGDPLRGKGRGPVPGGQFGAARDYGGHQGVDFPAPKGTTVFSTGQGTEHVSTSPHGGNIVTVTQPDGTVWKYMHLGEVKVKDGDAVTPDTVVGTVGMTGRSTGPHLHVEEWRDGKPVDPRQTIGRAQQSPQRHDLNELYGQIDARAAADAKAGNPWTPEKVERWKQEVDRRVSRDELLANRRDQAAMRSALDTVDHLGDNFTDISQIPNAGSLAPSDRIQLSNMAEQNRKAKEKPVTANGDTVVTLKVLAARDPEAFKGVDLRQFRPFMSPGEFESLAVDQAQLRAKPVDDPTANLRTEIDSAIGFYGKDIGLNIDKRSTPQQREQYGRMTDLMREYIDRATGKKRKPTDDEMKAAFDYATMQVVVRTPGVLWGVNRRSARRFEAAPGEIEFQIPNDIRDRIVASLKKSGHANPTARDIGDTYMQYKGRPGFWQ